MGKFQSITISGDKEVSSNVNGAGDGLSGKVVPLNPSKTSVDRIQHSDSNSFHDTAKHGSVTLDGSGKEGLASARTPYDTPIANAGDINAKSSVVFEGRQMYVSTAVSLGYLKMEAGQYVEVDLAEARAKAETEKALDQTNVQEIDFMDETGRDNIKALNDAGSPQLTQGFAHNLIGNMVDGKECNSIVDTFSQQIGADPSSVVEAMEDLFSTQLERAGEYVNSRYGVDADAFINWVSDTAPKHIKKMSMVAAFHNDLSTLDQLVKAFRQKKVL
jgi:hypothetical protein